MMYDLEYGRVVDSFRAHDDAVSCLVWSLKGKICAHFNVIRFCFEFIFIFYFVGNLLVSGGWDCVVRVWSSLDGFGKGVQKRPLESLKAEFDHDSKITSIALDK